MRANWNPPSIIGAGRLSKKTVQIKLTLMPDGTIENPEIISSSGSDIIDRSVIDAFKTLKSKIIAPKETLEFIFDFFLVS